MNWKTLDSIHGVSLIGEMSFVKKQAIFKHSSRCSTSSMIKNRLERDYNIANEKMDIYFLDLIAFRNVSDNIEDRWKVLHESPQLLIIENDQVVHHSSHTSISVDRIMAFIH